METSEIGEAVDRLLDAMNAAIVGEESCVVMNVLVNMLSMVIVDYAAALEEDAGGLTRVCIRQLEKCVQIRQDHDAHELH
jgi:hypothetical protein